MDSRKGSVPYPNLFSILSASGQRGPKLKAAHFTVKGKVQGVGFRYFATREARRLNLSGWVRNLPDRSVETYAEGDEESLKAFEAALRQGPSWSRVTEVLVSEAPVTSETGFKIRW